MQNLDLFALELLKEIKNDALVLGEAFIFDEKSLRSAIADINEQPYENLFRLAKNYGAINKVSFTNHYLNTIKRASVEAFPKL